MAAQERNEKILDLQTILDELETSVTILKEELETISLAITEGAKLIDELQDEVEG